MMGTTRPNVPQHWSRQQQPSRPILTARGMTGTGISAQYRQNNGGSHYANAAHNYYSAPPPPPPRPPRPPQALSFISPSGSDRDVPLPPGESELPTTTSAANAFSNYSQNRPPLSHQQSLSPALVPPIDGTFAPLVPPPLPPVFPYLSQELAQSLHDGATQCGKSFVEESADLPFIPVIVNEKDLKSMTESVKMQFEETQQTSRNLLLYEDIINPTWPKELRDMFQPLYCKLCQLTLSSPIVARDHYKGRRHNRGAEVWMQENAHKVPTRLPVVNGTKLSNLIQGGENRNFPNAPISGTIKPLPGNKNAPRFNSEDMGFARPTPPPVYSNQHGYDRSPAPVPPKNNYNSSVKRNADGNQVSRQNEFIPAYRAALASPGPSRKKLKKEGGGGPNFGYCPLCDVYHTSSITAEQHYSGKNHKIKLLEIQKGGQQL